MTRRTVRPLGLVLLALHENRRITIVVSSRPPPDPGPRRRLGPSRVAACLVGVVCLCGLGGCWL